MSKNVTECGPLQISIRIFSKLGSDALQLETYLWDNQIKNFFLNSLSEHTKDMGFVLTHTKKMNR